MSAMMTSIETQMPLVSLFLSVGEARRPAVGERSAEQEQEQRRLAAQIEIAHQEDPERWDGLL